MNTRYHIKKPTPKQSASVFKIRVGNSKLFWLIYVHSSQSKLQAETKIDCGGALLEYDYTGTCLGEIHFSKDNIGSGAIAHECMHAAFAALMRRYRKRRKELDMFLLEENLCTYHEHLVQKVVDTFHKAGFYKDASWK